ncbi:hypothetical protein Tco_0653147 [Tanacetum coccineum]|uniref:Uncharacterized protein n=1 Tax=Tanacetum coccineum TaxID=301880 RepID=A0ABQ4WZK2_9ASTR
MSKKELLKLDEELAFKLQAEEEEEEERLAREKAQQVEESNIAWDDVQAKIDVEESSKKAETKQEESSKKAKAEIAQESNDRDDVTIDATPLSTKSPTIVDYKIYKEGKKSYFQIIRADVKVRFKKTKLVNYMDNFLLLNLNTMFEHHVEDNNMLFYLLVEKMYPLTNHTLHQMFNDVKLQVDYECEIAFELLRLVKKQLKEGYGRIIRIKNLLEVTAAKLMLLVYKLLLLVLKVNAASTKVTTAQRLRLLKEFLLYPTSWDNYTSLVGTVKDTINAKISSLLDIKIQSKVTHIQSPFVLRVPVSVISEPTVLTLVQETSSAALVTTLPLPSVFTTPPAPQQTTTPIPTPPITTDAPIITTAIPESDALSVVQQRVAKLEKDVSALKNVDHSAATIATLKSKVPMLVDNYLGSKLGDALQKSLQKHSEDLIHKHSMKPAPEFSKIKTKIVNLEKGSEKSASKILKIKREQVEK